MRTARISLSFVSLVTCLVTGFLVTSCVQEAQAATGINRQINFQGKLVQGTGGANPNSNVANGSYSIVFTLYDHPTGGTAVWSETQTVGVTDGIFRVSLGAVTPIPSNINFNWDGSYLGMKVGSDAEMTPRIRMAAVPYAFNAEKVAGLTVTDENGIASTSGTLKIPNGKTISFGGAFTTTAGLDLSLTLSGNTTLSFGGNGGLTLVDTNTSQTITNKTIGSSGLTFSGAAVDLTTASNETLTLSPNGTGTVLVTGQSGGQAVLVIDKTGTGDIFTASSSGTTKFTLSQSGNVSIAGVYTSGNGTGINVASYACVTATGGIVTGSGACPSTGGSGSNWTLDSPNGILRPNNTTLDLLLGGTATPSAKFAVLNMTGTATPVASISATGATNRPGISLGGDGVMQSINKGTLTLGGSTTGNIILNPRNGILGGYVAPNTTRVTDLGRDTQRFQTIYLGKNGGVGGTAIDLNDGSNNGTIGTVTGGLDIQALNLRYLMPSSGASVNDSFYILDSAASNATRMNIFREGAAAFGSNFDASSAIAGFSVQGNYKGNALALFDQRGAQDILVASSSGTTRLVVNNNGNVGIGTATPTTARLDLRSTLGTLPAASISANTSFAGLVVDNKGTGDILAASSSGLTRFSVQQNGTVQIGSGGAGSATPGFLGLDVKSTTGDPTGGFEGAMYYNTFDKKFRCYQGTGWTDCAGVHNTSQSFVSGLANAAANSAGQVAEMMVMTSATAVSFTAGVTGYTAPTSGSFRTCLMKNNAAITAGTISVRWRVNNVSTGSAACAMDNTAANNRQKAESVASGTVKFAAGDTIGIAMDTNSTYAPITDDFTVYWTVEYDNGADVAEQYYTKDDTITPGDVVALDSSLYAGVKKSSQAYDAQVLGIVSTAPGLVMGEGQGPARGVPIALSGRVPVKVSTENGAIKPGDLLTASSMPGVAQKATKAGQVIGQAMEGYSGEQVGFVTAFIKTSYYMGADPVNMLSGLTSQDQDDLAKRQQLPRDFSIGKQVLEHFLTHNEASATVSANLSAISTDRIAAGLEVITPKVTTDTIALNSIRPATGIDITLQLGENGKFAITNTHGEPVITFDSDGNADFKGTVTAKTIRAEHIEGLEILVGKLTSFTPSSSSAVLGVTTAALPAPTNAPQVTPTEVPIAISPVLPTTGLATVSGNLRVKGNGLFEGVVSIIDSLTTQNLIVQRLATFFDTVVFKKDIQIEGRAIVSNDSAGFAVIRKDAREVEIVFAKAYDTVPVITANVDLGIVTLPDGSEEESTVTADRILKSDYRFVITKKTTTGFTIMLARPTKDEIRFSWTATAVKEAKTSLSQPTPTPAPPLDTGGG